jgi:multicomponent Na+:H+ antiporter subunit D
MTLIDHLPILVVLVPLFVAPLLAMLPSRGNLAWGITLLSSLLTFAIAVGIAFSVQEHGELLYELGNWPVPFGIGLAIGPFSALMLLVISGASLAALAWGRASMNAEVGYEHQTLLYSCWLLALAGLIGITVTGDAFNVFVFMEISSLASYVLVANGPSRQALTASFKYLVTGTLGATFYLIGVGYLYMMTGTLNLADMAVRVGEVSETMPVLIASGFLLMGLALKAALFPMHAWMPNAYQFAPTPVTLFFAACSTKVALFVLIRFDFLVLQPNLGALSEMFAAFLIPLCAAGFLVGSTVAIFERDLKRMLGYSSVAQIGYILLAVSLASAAGLTAAVVHMFNHALMKAALFMAVGGFVLRYGTSNLDQLAGAGKTMPLTMLAFVLAGLSLIGVPLTAGFISKWLLIQALLEMGAIGIALTVLVLVSSLLAVVYVWKVVEVAYFREPSAALLAKSKQGPEAPLAMSVLLWLLVAANFYFGLEPSLPVSLGQMEAAQFFGGQE